MLTCLNRLRYSGLFFCLDNVDSLTEYCIDESIVTGQNKVYTIRALDKDKNFISYFNTKGWSFTK